MGKSYRKQRKIERGELSFEDKQQKFYLDYGKKNPMQVVDKVSEMEEIQQEDNKEAFANWGREEEQRSHGWWVQSQKKVGKKIPVLYQGKTLESNPYGFNLGYKQL